MLFRLLGEIGETRGETQGPAPARQAFRAGYARALGVIGGSGMTDDLTVQEHLQHIRRHLEDIRAGLPTPKTSAWAALEHLRDLEHQPSDGITT